MSNISNISVFEKSLSLLSIENFRCPVSDTYAKKLLTGPAILLFVEAHMRQLESLEAIADNLKAEKQLQSYLKLDSIDASTLCRKLSKLPTTFLQGLMTSISEQLANVDVTDKLSNLGRLGIIDSTEISLPKKAGEWAYCSESKNGIKVHLLYEWVHENVQYPKEFVSSTAAVSDQEATIYLVKDENTTYVFDRGYINYLLYREWVLKNIRFVARIKANSKTYVLEEYSVKEDSLVIRDAKVEIKVPKSGETVPLRLVEYTDEQGKLYRVLTNRWDLSAEEVAEIYRHRWQIEIFFKWIKQHLQTVKWYSYHPNAVWNQIYIAFIAYGLTELIKRMFPKTETKKALWRVLQKLRRYWFQPWDKLVQVFHYKPEKTSIGRKKKGKPGRPRKHPKKLKAIKKFDPNL